MARKLLTVVLATGLVLWAATGTVYAGIEPSPFQPELKELHSIQYNLASIQRSVDSLVSSTKMPLGSNLAVSGMKYKLKTLNAQVTEVLAGLPNFYKLGDDQEQVYLALELIRISVQAMENPLDYILSRLGVEPSPFKDLLDSISSQISKYYAG